MTFAASPTVAGLGNRFNYTSSFSSAAVLSNSNCVADLVARTSINNSDTEDITVSEGCCGASSVAGQRDRNV